MRLSLVVAESKVAGRLERAACARVGVDGVLPLRAHEIGGRAAAPAGLVARLLRLSALPCPRWGRHAAAALLAAWGEGSVYRRGKTGPWMAQLSIGGVRQRRYLRRTAREVGYPDTRRGALAVLEDLKAEQRDGLQLARQSLGDYLRSWLDETAKPAISANTYRGYEDVLAHLAPIATIPLRDLAAEDLERAFNQMVVRRGKTQEPASAKTVRNAQIMVRRALRSAEMRGHIRRNVALQVPLRRVPRNPRAALTPDMARSILAAVAGDRYEAAFALAFIGLREGEILGLSHGDIDLDACTAAVRYELVGSGPAATRHQLKTEASEATVPLPAFVVARLRSHLERQRQERPDEAPDAGLVFVTERG